jgi:hypothetical protein
VLNIRAAAPVTSGVESDDEKTSEKEPEKGHISTEAHEAVDYESPIITVDPDLDPVSLDKAFRFAAWSSVALVCDLPPRSGTDSDDLMHARLLSCSF